ncbi:helix-turn-helix domain-containing protein [Streptomyces glomeratus]|uniref:Helix-turn-helix domain-containing protein n=1 Tax=Streptomyces glomeratus TaxID=284452 RepID=A0ABP6LCK3_9ACTN|nr:helix-turn-helix domain-containing protein [Streptomyces glomeratus]MCF1507053.1 helix-turn-helix domain-containing protein [Streptomyces glomeratus]
MEDEWLTPKQVAAQLDVHPGTLANWRAWGRGPRFSKLTDAPNSPVRYRRTDVIAYQQQTHQGAA